MAPQLWQELHYYEVVDTLKSADEQIRYYEAKKFAKPCTSAKRRFIGM